MSDFCIAGDTESPTAKEVAHILSEAGFSIDLLDVKKLIDVTADEYKSIVFLISKCDDYILAIQFGDAANVNLSPELIIDLRGIDEGERKRRILEAVRRLSRKPETHPYAADNFEEITFDFQRWREKLRDFLPPIEPEVRRTPVRRD